MGKIQNPKSPEGIPKSPSGFLRNKIQILFIFILLFSSATLALDNPEQKISRVIEDYITAKYPHWAGLDIRITFKYADKIFRALEGLEDDARITVLETYKDFKPVGNVIIPMEVATKDTAQKIFVRARVEIFKNVVAAANLIKRGKKIGAADLKLEKRDIAFLPQKYFESIEAVVSTKAKTTIPKMSTLFEWMVKPMPLVHRGDKITIKVTAQNLVVKSEGVALSDGYLGEKMAVKRKDAKKNLEGVVISANEVEVKLE